MPTMAKPGPKPRDPSEVRSVPVPLRTTPPSRELWEAAQIAAGRESLNDWAVRVLDAAAKRQLKKK